MPTKLKRERLKIRAQRIKLSKQTGKAMRELRLKRGIKSCWVAAEMGVSDSMLNYLEKGERSWTPGLEAAFLKAIGETNNQTKKG
jgi:predicted transcriptional regulator